MSSKETETEPEKISKLKKSIIDVPPVPIRRSRRLEELASSASSASSNIESVFSLTPQQEQDEQEEQQKQQEQEEDRKIKTIFDAIANSIEWYPSINIAINPNSIPQMTYMSSEPSLIQSNSASASASLSQPEVLYPFQSAPLSPSLSRQTQASPPPITKEMKDYISTYISNPTTAPDIYLTTISLTDSLLSTELDPKKVLCNIQDWVILGTISTDFSNMLFGAVDKLMQVHIRKEQENNPGFNSTILLGYLSALKLRLESVFQDNSPVDLIESNSYTDLLKKLFGKEVGQQFVETTEKQKAQDIAKGRPIKETKIGSLNVRDEYLATLANTSQCIAAVGKWDISKRCWITDINLSQYKQAGKCPPSPCIDCEHMAAFLFQILHANFVQLGIKTFRKQPEMIQSRIRQFYDWSFHGPNIIKNDDEWFEFNQTTGMFGVKMIEKQSSKSSKTSSTEEAFRQTLRTIKDHGDNNLSMYGTNCINMKRNSGTGLLKADLSSIVTEANYERLKRRIEEVTDNMNIQQRELYKFLEIGINEKSISGITIYDPNTGAPIDLTSALDGLTSEKILAKSIMVYNYMCIFKFLSNIPTLQFINMITHTANITALTKKGGSQKGGQPESQPESLSLDLVIPPSVDFYYILDDGTLNSVRKNLLSNRDETDKSIKLLMYLHTTDIDDIMTDIVTLDIPYDPSSDTQNQLNIYNKYIGAFCKIKSYQIETAIQNAIQNEFITARERRPPITRISKNTFHFNWSAHNYIVIITFNEGWDTKYRSNQSENISYMLTIYDGKKGPIPPLLLNREEITYFVPKTNDKTEKNILIISLNQADGLKIPENNELIYDVNELLQKQITPRGGKKDKRNKKGNTIKKNKISKKNKKNKISKKNKTKKNKK